MSSGWISQRATRPGRRVLGALPLLGLLACFPLAGSVSASTTVSACVVKGGALHFDRNNARCRRGERRLSWSIRGSSGARGVTGAIGPAGVAAPKGADGVAGANGATGANGAVGATGARGASEASGVTGATGVAGATGATGTLGVTGAQGATGPTGAPGGAGATGIVGPGSEIATNAQVGETSGDEAECPAGDVILGGGGKLETNANAVGALQSSYPTSIKKWAAVGVVTSASEHTGTLKVKAYAICAPQ